MRAFVDCKRFCSNAIITRGMFRAFGRSITCNSERLSTPSYSSVIQVQHDASFSSIAFDSKEAGGGVWSSKSFPRPCPHRSAMTLLMHGNKPYISRMHKISEYSLKWYGSVLCSAEGKGSDGPVVVDYSSLLSEKDFHEIAETTMEHLQERIEAYGEDLVIDGFDTDYAEGVLTVRLGSMGTYVINKQTPNRQIWLSSPVSGPARFDWHEGTKLWVYRRTNANLVSLLQKELSKLLKADIDLNI